MAKKRKGAQIESINLSKIIETNIENDNSALSGIIDESMANTSDIKERINKRLDSSLESNEELTELFESLSDLDKNILDKQVEIMIDTDDIIYDANSKIRAYDFESLEEHVTQIDDDRNEMNESFDAIIHRQQNIAATFAKGETDIYLIQSKIDENIIQLLQTYKGLKNNLFANHKESVRIIIQSINELENKFHHKTIETEAAANNEIKDIIRKIGDITKDIDDIDENLDAEFSRRRSNLEDSIAAAKKDKKTLEEQLLKEFNDADADIKDLILTNVGKNLDDTYQKQLKDLKLRIFIADKANRKKIVKELFKEYMYLANKGTSIITSTKAKSAKENESNELKKSLIVKLKQNEISFINKVKQLEYELNIISLEHSDFSSLESIKIDRDKVLNEKNINKIKTDSLYNVANMTAKFNKDKLKAIFNIRKAEYNFFMECDQLEVNLKVDIEKDLHKYNLHLLKRAYVVKNDEYRNQLDKIKHMYLIKRLSINQKYNLLIYKINKDIITKTNEYLIRNAKIEKEAKSGIVVEQQIIDLATKEYEVVVSNIGDSSDENNIIDAEASIENKSNDTFVISSLKNQIDFAEQQIQSANSEFEKRIENIKASLEAEVSYSQRKLDELVQEYTSKKEKAILEKETRINSLTNEYNKYNPSTAEAVELKKFLDDTEIKLANKIKGFEEQITKDPKIIMYQRTIDDARLRSEKNLEDALGIKESTVLSFKELYEKSKNRYELLLQRNGIENNSDKIIEGKSDVQVNNEIEYAKITYEKTISNPKARISQINQALSVELKTNVLEQYVLQQRSDIDTILSRRDQEIAKLSEEEKQGGFKVQDRVRTIEIYYNKSIQACKDKLRTKIKNLQLELQAIQDDTAAKFSRLDETLNSRLTHIDQNLEHELTSLTKLSNEFDQMIEAATKPYEDYIKKGSSGFDEKKKQLETEHKKSLRMAMTEIETKYEDILKESK